MRSSHFPGLFCTIITVKIVRIINIIKSYLLHQDCHHYRKPIVVPLATPTPIFTLPILFHCIAAILIGSGLCQLQLCIDIGMCFTASCRGGTLPNTNSPISIRDEWAWRLPIRKRRPQLFWPCVEGWLTQRVRDRRENCCRDSFCAPCVILWKSSSSTILYWIFCTG